jgi:hypothetical protein
MVRRNINVAMRYHEFVISLVLCNLPDKPAAVPASAARPPADPKLSSGNGGETAGTAVDQNMLAIDFRHAGAPRKIR